MTAIKKNIVFIFIILILLAPGLYSQDKDLSKGQKYREVERLISIYDFNAAINLLVEIVKEDPEEMDRAQKLIQEIREKKDEFNAKYEELIRVLFEENDYQKGLEIISELEDLDKNPNDATSESLTSARISAELIYFRLLFNELMDRALVQIGEGNFDTAATIYRTGFELHKRTYNERDYGDIIKGPVDRNLEALLSSLDEFVQDYSLLSQYSAAELSSSIGVNQSLNAALADDISRFSDLRNKVWNAAYVFEEQNRLLGEISAEYKEDFFLSFANRIIFGRLETRFEEGLIRAFDEYWDSAVIPIQESLISKTETVMNQAESEYRTGQWEQAQSSFEEAEYWAERSLEIAESWAGRLNADETMNLHPYSQDLMRREYHKLENSRINSRKAAYNARLSSFQDSLEDYKIYDNQNLAEMEERRQDLNRELSLLEPLKEEWTTFITGYNSDILYTDSFASLESSRTNAVFDESINAYRLFDGKLALDSADLEITPLERDYNDMKDSLDRALGFLAGVQPEGAAEDDFSILYVFPQNSYDILEDLKERNNDLSSRASVYKAKYQNARRSIPQQQQMSVYIGRAEALILNLEDQLRNYTREQRRADQSIATAERYLGEGEFRFARAREALNNKDFSQATQQLTTAQELFVQALSFNEAIINRNQLDQRIADLQNEILLEQNKEVIRFVRDNVNQGKSLYLQGLYGQSEIVLLRAENRWFTTNTDENNEINYWLNLVRAALSVESGRTIEETEPLYAEMTQFLNLAFANFEAGSNKIAAGDTEEGFRLLDRADANLNEILIPMPLNQQASVLKLKIQQLKDPDLFKITFEEKFKSAVSKIRTEPDTAYIDLKDLSAIQPDYPGMARALYDVEIILGIRIPPPDLRAIAESEDLYNKAFVIVEGNVRSQFPVALTQLDRAIELNPENQEAIELKDRIQLDAGGQTAIVLSSSDNARFKAAEEKYINGEYFEAYAIVQQLLNDKQTASYPPLQDLKRRIESKF
ncbi:MAG: hypothetical protein PQJ58_02685 [Spirochaetales bacterium]|nr:hypothetical protein [Spirochaetales bacterium]